MNTSIEKNICEAVDIIVKKALSEASYDKTIQATVIECVDALSGKYKIRYQDSIFYAYSNNIDTTYNKNASVYVLFPGNDSSKDKTILGTVKNLGLNYNIAIEDKDAYEINGNNVISSSSTFGLSSYRKNTYTKVLYHKDFTEEQNLIKLNKTSIEQYIKTSKNIKCSAKIRTSLELKQQFRGNYGIIFAFDFIDNASEELVTRHYTLDVDKMIGNPYKLITETTQYSIFEIDNLNFKEVNYISLFTYNFPITKEESECIDDIFIKDIELCGVNKLKEDDISNYSLTFTTPQGIYFGEGSLDTDTLSVQAVVRIKNKVLESTSQGLSFYWFSKNVGITSGSQYYNKYGGQGWKCLNQFNVIAAAGEGEEDLVEWIPGSDKIDIKKSDVLSKEITYKCVAVYQGSIISKEIIIKNLVSEFDLSIVSDSGTEFYYDIGRPTLKCLINGGEKPDYAYAWSVTDNNGTFQSLAPTAALNEEYQKTKTEYDNLSSAIESELVSYELNKDKLEKLKNKLDILDNEFRVDGNTLYKLNVNTITNFSLYSCAVYKDELYLGTVSLTLTNSFETKNGYSLVIENGSKVYKYDENGISPASKSLDSPIEINALTFSIYDNKGNRLDDEVTRHCDILWTVPDSDSMIKISNEYPVSKVDLINKTKSYKDIMSLSYFIEDRYNINKNRNTITLNVVYKDLNLIAETDFLFIKEGESGTNGTDIVCRIIPNVLSGDVVPQIPMVTEFKNGSYEWNYTPAAASKYFKVQLWKDGDKIFDNTETGLSADGKDVIVNWSVLRNTYARNIQDSTSFEINAATGVIKYNKYLSSSPANIIKVLVTYDKISYYATIPIVTIKLKDNKYRLYLKDNTGFKYAIYTSEGKTPKYDTSNPFELIVKKNIQGDIFEDISLKASEEYNVDYQWDYLGEIYENKEWIPSINLEDRYLSKLEKTQKSVKPIDDFDGQCVTNALEGTILKNGNEVAYIHIPIHLYLNRYGNSAINGWDGNSVNIDEDGGFILAPQIGAGIKEKDNSFTGVVMGKVKESNASKEDIGLLGYSKGQRSIFLDSETGSASFGVNGKGQVIIDPSSDKAIIQSGNYDEKDGSGMQIDFTTPEIKFGSKNFSVDKNGYLIAKGGGSIAGWNISDTKLYKENVGISSDYKTDDSLAFWAGGSKPENSKFSVSFGGHLKVSTATIGSGTNKISIGKSINDSSISAIFSGKKDGFSSGSSGFYLGTDGIALGAYDGNVSRFQVTKDGELTARSGYIGNGRSGWTIQDNALVNGEKTTYADDGHDGVYLGKDGISLGNGNPFSVSASGSLKATSGTVGGWTLNNGMIRSKENEANSTIPKMFLSPTSGIRIRSGFSVNSNGKLSCTGADVSGKITASSGTIGGWKINASTLTGGQMTIDSTGSMKGPNWSIDANGKASFSNLHASGATIAGSSFSGGSVSSSSVTGGVPYGGSFRVGSGGYNGNFYADPSHFKINNLNMDNYIKGLIVDNLTINNILEFKGKNIGWVEAITSILSMTFTNNKKYCSFKVRLWKVLGQHWNNTNGYRDTSLPSVDVSGL